MPVPEGAGRTVLQLHKSPFGTQGAAAKIAVRKLLNTKSEFGSQGEQSRRKQRT